MIDSEEEGYAEDRIRNLNAGRLWKDDRLCVPGSLGRDKNFIPPDFASLISGRAGALRIPVHGADAFAGCWNRDDCSKTHFID